MTHDTVLKDQLVAFLRGGQSHMPFKDAIKDFPLSHINDIFPNGQYSFWQLLEHIRFTQKDILDFMINPDYVEPIYGRKITGRQKMQNPRLLCGKILLMNFKKTLRRL